ncbi:MAG: hypothetical protein KDN22_10130 [Verrucomicrobiae bacterium]|nr:hypothetical protein [Verrucomicrobiae bacterium]
MIALRLLSIAVSCVFLGASVFAQGMLELTSPVDFQVIQRETLKSGKVKVAGSLSEVGQLNMIVDARLGEPGHDWGVVAQIPAGQRAFAGEIELPAGGWYRLEVRLRSGDNVLAESRVDHVGVGEVFVIAGQSNSANHGSEQQKASSGLVAAFDGKAWKIANDPQPGASGGGGSFIPPFGDAIASRFKVPVGIVATGVGATSVREWLPKDTVFLNPPTIMSSVTETAAGEWQSNGRIFENFVTRVNPLGPLGFRAVLWHQGESDANQSDPSRTLPGDLYQKFLTQLIVESRREIGWEFPWFVAQASYHTPDDPGSGDIRSAQVAVWESGVGLQGPDTDALTGALRDSDGKGVHFSGDGLRAHAKSWVDKVAPWLDKQLHADSAVRAVQVVILAGQSNVEGQGVVAMDHPDYYNGGKGNLVWSMEHSESKERMQHLRGDDGKWTVRNDVEISFKVKGEVRRGGLTIGYTGYGGDTHIGPELQLGHVLGDYFSQPVLLIKTAWGGKRLQVDFRPPSSGGVTGTYYQQMVEEVREALGELGGQPYEIAGFVWMQGWNDMISKEATAEYDTNLVNLVNDIRAEFKVPELPVVIGELGNGGEAKPGSGMDAFRQAQQRAVRKLSRAIFVPTQSFARPAELSPNRGHGHHWFGNAESYFLIGDALGNGLLELVK